MFKWFPGHMHRGRKAIEELKKRVDVVIDVRDARAPLATQNPLFDEYLGAKPQLVILNKSDRADASVTRQWVNYFKKSGKEVLLVNALQKSSVKPIVDLCISIAQRSYRPGRPITAMIIGVPNVGKSTLMNALAGRKIAATGNLPALTRVPQRISITPEFELFDMPGILDPNPKNETSQYILALISAMRDTVIDYISLGEFLIQYCQAYYPQILGERYRIQDPKLALYEMIAYLAKHYGKQNLQDVGALVVQDFREGRLGLITLERPPA